MSVSPRILLPVKRIGAAGTVLRRRVDDRGAGRLVDSVRARRAGRRRCKAVRRLPGLAEGRRSGAAVRRVQQPAGLRSSGSPGAGGALPAADAGQIRRSGRRESRGRHLRVLRLLYARTGLDEADRVHSRPGGYAAVEHRNQEHRYRHRLLAGARRGPPGVGVARARAQRRTALPSDRMVLRRQDRFHVAGDVQALRRRDRPSTARAVSRTPPNGPWSRSAGRAASPISCAAAASSCWESAWAPTRHPATST